MLCILYSTIVKKFLSISATAAYMNVFLEKRYSKLIFVLLISGGGDNFFFLAPKIGGDYVNIHC